MGYHLRDEGEALYPFICIVIIGAIAFFQWLLGF